MARLLVIIALLGLVIVAGAFFWFTRTTSPTPLITSFDECAAAGYPVMESYPAQCRTPDGQTFVQIVPSPSPVAHTLIQVTAPQPGQSVGDPFAITGQARGTWFFEASFPVRLTAADGTLLATSFAQAEGEWMTENFVPFRAEFDVPDTVSGPVMLVLEKDNPSGLTEHADMVSFPITIKR